MKKILLPLLTVLLIVLSGCAEKSDHSAHTKKQTSEPTATAMTNETKVIRSNKITLIAQERMHALNKDITVPVWTYNGTVPGPEITVKQGETVSVTLKNKLPVPTAIHWHGYPVKNPTDGVPGVTQDAVLPGESYTY
ncbi:MAG: multicopper oxidase domain-containing protein, partial [Bacilli bacterium]